MCNFMSAIVTRYGTILHHWAIDSHSELIAHFNLHEGGRAVVKDQDFIRVELTPPKRENDAPDYTAVDGYQFTVDEYFTPDWFTSDMRVNVESFLREQIGRMIVRDKREVLIGGCWIIADGAEIGMTHSARLFVSGGTIDLVSGGTINRVSGGTINLVSGGTINRVSGGTINLVYGGTIDLVYGGTINLVSGGTINLVSGGTIDLVYGGTIDLVYGGTINRVSGGTINRVSGGTINLVSGGTIVRDARTK